VVPWALLVFAAGLTNVGVVLTVRDTLTGEERVWESGEGEKFESIQDTSAFMACPDSGSSVRP